MAFTKEDLQRIDEIIKSGATSATYPGKSVKFRPYAELLILRAFIKAHMAVQKGIPIMPPDTTGYGLEHLLRFNPDLDTVENLEKIEYLGRVYRVTGSGGTVVVANPADSATGELNKINIGGTVYSLPDEVGDVVLAGDGITITGTGTKTITVTNPFTSADESKLDGITAGAEPNVQSDWNATSGDAFIKNKPAELTAGTGITISNDEVSVTNPFTAADETKLDGIASNAEVNVQSDWNQTTTTADDYIKNKPAELTAGTGITIASDQVSVTNPFTDADETKLDGIAANAQVNVKSDWLSTTGDSQILSKPPIRTNLFHGWWIPNGGGANDKEPNDATYVWLNSAKERFAVNVSNVDMTQLKYVRLSHVDSNPDFVQNGTNRSNDLRYMRKGGSFSFFRYSGNTYAENKVAEAFWYGFITGNPTYHDGANGGYWEIPVSHIKHIGAMENDENFYHRIEPQPYIIDPSYIVRPIPMKQLDGLSTKGKATTPLSNTTPFYTADSGGFIKSFDLMDLNHAVKPFALSQVSLSGYKYYRLNSTHIGRNDKGAILHLNIGQLQIVPKDGDVETLDQTAFTPGHVIRIEVSDTVYQEYYVLSVGTAQGRKYFNFSSTEGYELVGSEPADDTAVSITGSSPHVPFASVVQTLTNSHFEIPSTHSVYGRVLPTGGSTGQVATKTATGVAWQAIPSVDHEQSDWNEDDNTDPAFIKNKPTITDPDYSQDNLYTGTKAIVTAGTGVTITADDTGKTLTVASSAAYAGPTLVGSTSSLGTSFSNVVTNAADDDIYLITIQANNGGEYYMRSVTQRFADISTTAHWISLKGGKDGGRVDIKRSGTNLQFRRQGPIDGASVWVRKF